MEKSKKPSKPGFLLFGRVARITRGCLKTASPASIKWELFSPHVK
jgi:hypothetical protein